MGFCESVLLFDFVRKGDHSIPKALGTSAFQVV
jgi:hypothetical protein